MTDETPSAGPAEAPKDQTSPETVNLGGVEFRKVTEIENDDMRVSVFEGSVNAEAEAPKQGRPSLLELLKKHRADPKALEAEMQKLAPEQLKSIVDEIVESIRNTGAQKSGADIYDGKIRAMVGKYYDGAWMKDPSRRKVKTILGFTPKWRDIDENTQRSVCIGFNIAMHMMGAWSKSMQRFPDPDNIIIDLAPDYDGDPEATKKQAGAGT